MTKELEALKRIKEHCEHYYDARLGEMKEYQLIEQALNDLEDVKHNYKALEEMHNNSVAYAIKIQNELNELRKRNEPRKIVKKTEVSVEEQVLIHTVGLCPNCNRFIKNIWNRCPKCDQKLDWSDEK